MTRIALVQMQCDKGDLRGNLGRISGFLEEAADHGVDIVGFPEMSLMGYADPTRYPEALNRLDGPEVAAFLHLTEPYPFAVLAGIIEENPIGKPFITQLVARQGLLEGSYRKVTIKDEETEWFSAGQEIPVFQADGLPYGIAICADISNETVFAECRRQGARIVFELAAPGLYGEQATRNWESGYRWWEGECLEYLSRYAREYGIWVPVATQAGRTVDEDFPGGGYVFAPGGERVYATRDWMPGALYLGIDLETGRVLEL